MILDGKIASAAAKEALKIKVAAHVAKGQRKPHLAAILVGNNGASETYVASKVKNCEEVGFESSLIRMEATATQNELLVEIEKLNNNPAVDGILVQLPLPKHIDENTVIQAIKAEKDVDGFHPINAGKLMQGLPSFLPATPYGIMMMLKHYNIETKGKHAVVIGRSNIVGRPMSVLLSGTGEQANCTVTLCHRYTNNIKAFCQQADIIVAAVGIPHFVTADMVKPGAVIIDVGITRLEDATSKKGYKIVGDVKYDEVAPIASAITPVPGGVGLMTIAALLQNTLVAYENTL